ncbi:MAG: tRNA uracil 4-sulfurtransferase ThiI [Clostridiaceae bacterium]|nr:tRNA uracil 4-sulfurtransferase ThiI [Clostridiaceae bacterium]
MEVLLLKCGEMVLKGLNRNRFEERLLHVLRERLTPCGKFSLYSMQSTVTVTPLDDAFDMDRAFELARHVFGLVSVCRAAVCEKSMDDLYRTAPGYLSELLSAASTFKVDAKRSDKKFPFTSMDIMRELGAVLLDSFPHLRVDVNHPEVVIRVEIRDKHAFVHGPATPGAGGLPSGINGRAALLISGGIDSPVAAYMMARRGLSLTGIHFFSYPYTSPRALQKVRDLLAIVGRAAGDIPLVVVPFTRVQEVIRDNCPDELSTLVLRRCMMRVAQRIAYKKDCHALVTGESLGQVASQTLLALGVTDAVTDMPVFRPLIGMDKTDIVKIAREIGTFETSILPYEDCCTVFTPKHPKTKPKLYEIEAAEQKCALDDLLNEAFDRALSGDFMDNSQ